MKTFKQFLSEAPEFIDLKELIERECQPFLKKSRKEGLLLRGMLPKKGQKTFYAHGKGPDDALTVLEMTPRDNRQPSDMPQQYHTFLDRYFLDTVGFRARSQAVFCVGLPALRDISSYGRTHVVFPVGEFEYTWSPTVEDLYGDLIYRRYFRDAENQEEALRKHLDEQHYQTTQLNEAVTSKSEIMVKCSKYYAVEVDNDQLAFIEKLFNIAQ